MSDGEQLAYPEVAARIGELAEHLASHPDPAVSERVVELLDWVDVVHRVGLSQLVEMITQWRGEIFLESAATDDVAGILLDAYDLRDELAPEAPAPPPPQPALVQIRGHEQQ
ncbi:MAG: hypothetical protein KY452_09720 [Actinobacteria bacterium]|nr:hypothetical protein [Actinomycetota bacterium]